MAYKIKWKSGGETASRYSSKALAERVLKDAKIKGTIVKASIKTSPKRTLGGKETVWVRQKASNFGIRKPKGFIYMSRAKSVLGKAEKKRVVRR